MNKAILRQLGLTELPFDHVLMTYLPNRDRHGEEFDVEPWDTAALKLQGRLFGGATSYPARGSYRRSGELGEILEEGLVLEQTRLVLSFVRNKELTLDRLRVVSDFLKLFKKETNQESVALSLDGEMFYL